jgi:uncharacterized membrane protein YgcG
MEQHQEEDGEEYDDDYFEEEDDEDEEWEDDDQPPPLPTIHPDRCPPLDLAFMWRIYQKRHTSTVRPQDIVQAAERRRKERMATLRDQGFPAGLASLMLENAEKCPVRILLIDNSGTMNADDATMVTQSSGKIQTTECTRWEALTSCLVWHAEMAAWLQNPTVLRLLQDPGANIGPQQIGISSSRHYSSSEELKRMKQLFRATRPNGPASTTLCEHMEDVLSSISEMVPTLTQQDRRLMLCVFTDSIPLDEQGNFGQFLSMLRGWPVQVVLRLSTADERVLQFYRSLVQVFNVISMNPVSRPSLQPEGEERPDEGNTLDSNTDHGGDTDTNEEEKDDDDDDGPGRHPAADDNLPRKEHLQLMGDFMTEIERVKFHNPWLNYGFPLHLCREEGIGIHVVECLSQRPLDMKEVVQVASCIFGVDLLLDPTTDFRSLRSELETLNNEAGVLWSPVKKKFVPWIDLKRLDKIFLRGQSSSGGGGGGGGGASGPGGSGASSRMLGRGRSKRNQDKACTVM